MRPIDPAQITDNFISLIGKEWMLITAGDASSYNTMTASWGTIGFLWNHPVAFVFVRTERYTFKFMEQYEGFTLSFLGDRAPRSLQNMRVTIGTRHGQGSRSKPPSINHPIGTRCLRRGTTDSRMQEIIWFDVRKRSFLRSIHLRTMVRDTWRGP